LDPMCGSGQTVKVANNLKRKYIGVDLRKSYVTLAKKRTKEDLLQALWFSRRFETKNF